MYPASRFGRVALLSLLMGAWVGPAQADNGGQTNARQVAPKLSAGSLSAAERKLLGKHLFSLQWISWERFGVAEFQRSAQGLKLNARQELNGDWVTAEGRVEVVDDKTFYLTGQIVTRVHHINHGQPCVRSGRFQFLATGKRQYWRLQDMNNPCDQATDYVDVYFRKTR